MRLCGISSRFQLLSPSIRQVTHALLTRPPLTYTSLGFNVSPFDLHVLSTPPAFILSQDQTLMLKCLSCQMSSGITVCLSCSISRTCSLNNSWISYKILMESSGLHYCLFVKEHRCCFLRQLVNNITSLLLCQQLFLFSHRAVL